MPPGPVGKFLLTQMAAVAELEAGLTSQRTRAALAAVEARGTVLVNPRLRASAPDQTHAAAAAKSAQARGRASDVLAYLDTACRVGACILHKLSEALTNCDVATPAGKGAWRPEPVRCVVEDCCNAWPVQRLCRAPGVFTAGC